MLDTAPGCHGGVLATGFLHKSSPKAVFGLGPLAMHMHSFAQWLIFISKWKVCGVCSSEEQFWGMCGLLILSLGWVWSPLASRHCLEPPRG